MLLLAMLIAAAPTATPTGPALPAGFDQPVPAGKVTLANPRSIVAALQARGYRAKVEVEDGVPFIESAADGAKFYVYLQNCKDKRNCQDLLFTSNYAKDDKNPIKLESINEFNKNNRWVRAYLDSKDQPVLEYDVLFTDQVVDEKAFGEAIDIWSDMLTSFHKHIDF